MANALAHDPVAGDAFPDAARRGNSILGRLLIWIVFPLLIVACNHRNASEQKFDVCEMARDAVSHYLDAPLMKLNSSPPQAVSCTYTSRNERNAEARVEVLVLTKAGFDASKQNLDDMLRVMLAEAAQTYGTSSPIDLRDTAKTGVAYLVENGSSQVIFGERGLVLDIGSSGLPSDTVLQLSRDVWHALLAYKPGAPPKRIQVSQ